MCLISAYKNILMGRSEISVLNFREGKQEKIINENNDQSQLPGRKHCCPVDALKTYFPGNSPLGEK